MERRIRATWVSRRNRSIWCCDFSGFGSDRVSLLAEIEASEAVMRQQGEDSLLVAVDLCQAKMAPEIRQFFRTWSAQSGNPVHKMAILGVTDLQRLWYRLAWRMAWPKNSRFFDDWEKAKDWLVGERF